MMNQWMIFLQLFFLQTIVFVSRLSEPPENSCSHRTVPRPAEKALPQGRCDAGHGVPPPQPATGAARHPPFTTAGSAVRRSSKSSWGAGDEASRGGRLWRALLHRVPPTLAARSPRIGRRRSPRRGDPLRFQRPPRETYSALTGGLPAAATPDGTGKIPVAYLAAAGALPHGEQQWGAPQPRLPLPPPSQPPPESLDLSNSFGRVDLHFIIIQRNPAVVLHRGLLPGAVAPHMPR
ncbi:uncharacterized protein LOC115915360 [Camarhynchus parvulus]|uniref:uncharacterized protein LOC115915360 n=1 Tax=Geospiza parvula TaxID=87175 RepID=UPI001237E838|nr:uncharacterized protein LOC115915360 [Camarhynchus parvulus]